MSAAPAGATTDPVGNPLAVFSAPVAGWFRQTFGAPTPPQAQGWPVIARGENALILSPTGSGKTLTAFLWSLDVLFRELQRVPEPAPRRGKAVKSDYVPGIRVVYVSPLKALNNDVERNLDVPLRGIEREAKREGEAAPDIRVAVRTGDTPSAARQAMLRRPPHILITTPESLYLMLTGERAAGIFSTVHTVIVDEIHTLVGTKRGAHLTLSVERLERLAGRRVQRIGLSATVRPLENAARFLGGQDPAAAHAERPVTIVDAGSRKQMDLRVTCPINDFRNVPGNSIWPVIIPEVVDLIERHRTTLIFCNNRRLAERTADRLNEERLRRARGESAAPHTHDDLADLGMFAAGIDEQTLRSHGLEPIRAHHGSMSKTARLEMEGALKAGTLPALVATSSLELGIDIGEIDLVVHLQSPKSVGAGLQRVGRSGHLVGQTPKGRIYPTFPEDVVEAAAVARGMLAGQIESTATPEDPLDVLAQHVVAMVSAEDWSSNELYDRVRGAYPFRGLSEAAWRAVLEMLSGKYPSSLSSALRAKISWDRVNDRLTALPGSRLLAVRSGGTIPDRGMYSLVLPDHKTKVGELDEEFVFETRVGDNFLLGSQVWKAVEITEDRVIAEPAPGEVPRMPFWRGDFPWRPYDLGQRIGAFRRELTELVEALAPDELESLLRLDEGEMEAFVGNEEDSPSMRLLRFLRVECALDRNALALVVTHLTRQLDAVGAVATDRSVIVETYEDEVGAPRMVVHSPFGGRVNGPWGIALAGAIRDKTGIEAQLTPGDDGILLRFQEADAAPPTELVVQLASQEAREYLIKELPASPVFGAQFRMNAARALLLPREQGGRRTPLWLSRLKAKDLLQAVQRFDDFPIVLETYRDCLRDVMDLAGLSETLEKIERGEIRVTAHESSRPSPVAAGLDYRFAMRYVYEYDQPRGEAQLAALSLNRALLADLLKDGSLADLLKPDAVTQVAAQAARTAAEARARGPEELAQLIYELGDLTDAELAARADADADAVAGWLNRLEGSGRVVRREIAGEGRWVSAERIADYLDLRHHPLPVVRRYLAHAGPTTVADLSARYGLTEAAVRMALTELGEDVVSGQFTPGGPEQWIDRRNLEQIHRRTLSLLRKEVRPVSLSAYAAFLAGWQGVGHAKELEGVLRQLRGLAVSGVAWERDVLPARVHGFEAAELAERCQAGEAVWAAEGGKDARRARVRFFFRGEGGLFLERARSEEQLTELGGDARTVLDHLREEGAALLADLADGTGLTRQAVQTALVALVLAGLVTNDTLAALHAVLGFEPPRSARAALRSSLEAQLAERLGARAERPRALTPVRWREAKRRARETVAERRAGERALASGRGRDPAVAVGSAWTGRWSLVHRTG
ncbi:MAG TPA: DEAD/DEAH box helicase, partial [Chloroflexota bacterium]|nr:DEAD/DEAH box helicase [Chloroflexota bacterium]